MISVNLNGNVEQCVLKTRLGGPSTKLISYCLRSAPRTSNTRNESSFSTPTMTKTALSSQPRSCTRRVRSGLPIRQIGWTRIIRKKRMNRVQSAARLKNQVPPLWTDCMTSRKRTKCPTNLQDYIIMPTACFVLIAFFMAGDKAASPSFGLKNDER